MPHRIDLADQEMANWLFWWYKIRRNQLYPMSRGGFDSQLTAAEEQTVWDQVAFLARDRFPGEDEARLDDIMSRTRAAIATMPDPIVHIPKRPLEEIRAAATRNTRIRAGRRRR